MEKRHICVGWGGAGRSHALILLLQWSHREAWASWDIANAEDLRLKHEIQWSQGDLDWIPREVERAAVSEMKTQPRKTWGRRRQDQRDPRTGRHIAIRWGLTFHSSDGEEGLREGAAPPEPHTVMTTRAWVRGLVFRIHPTGPELGALLRPFVLRLGKQEDRETQGPNSSSPSPHCASTGLTLALGQDERRGQFYRRTRYSKVQLVTGYKRNTCDFWAGLFAPESVTGATVGVECDLSKREIHESGGNVSGKASVTSYLWFFFFFF